MKAQNYLNLWWIYVWNLKCRQAMKYSKRYKNTPLLRLRLHLLFNNNNNSTFQLPEDNPLRALNLLIQVQALRIKLMSHLKTFAVLMEINNRNRKNRCLWMPSAITYLNLSSQISVQPMKTPSAI
jgi:hypothetical protein